MQSAGVAEEVFKKIASDFSFWSFPPSFIVQAFANKNYPVECNQAKWISELVDYYVESIVNSPVSQLLVFCLYMYMYMYM